MVECERTTPPYYDGAALDFAEIVTIMVSIEEPGLLERLHGPGA